MDAITGMAENRLRSIITCLSAMVCHDGPLLDELLW